MSHRTFVNALCLSAQAARVLWHLTVSLAVIVVQLTPLFQPWSPPIPIAYADKAGLCATPGKDGPVTITGVVNTYYPGTANAAIGATAITLGAATGAVTPIQPGDLLLVIQMQDADFDSTNTAAYGDGIGGDIAIPLAPGNPVSGPLNPLTGPQPADTAASGTTTNFAAFPTSRAGIYEYVVATNAVGLGGGVLNISAALVNSYTNDLIVPNNDTSGQRTFQVIRVPQYSSVNIGSAGVTAFP